MVGEQKKEEEQILLKFWLASIKLATSHHQTERDLKPLVSLFTVILD